MRDQLKAHDYAACLLYNPLNIRYATGTRNMQVYSLHASERYAFVLAEGLTWAAAGGRTRTETDLLAWLGKRAAAGRLPPHGFPKSCRFG